MRDGRLERSCSTLCPGMRKLPGHFVLSHASPFGTGPKGESRPLSLPTGAKERGKKSQVALGAARPQCGRAAPDVTCADRRRERKPPAAGTNPMTSLPFEARPARRASPSSSVEGLKRFWFTPRYPLPSPPERPPFYPASDKKEQKTTTPKSWTLLGCFLRNIIMRFVLDP